MWDYRSGRKLCPFCGGYHPLDQPMSCTIGQKLLKLKERIDGGQYREDDVRWAGASRLGFLRYLLCRGKVTDFPGRVDPRLRIAARPSGLDS